MSIYVLGLSSRRAGRLDLWLSVQIADRGLNLNEDLPRAHQVLHGIVIGIEGPIDLEMPHMPANDLAGLLGAAPGSEFTEIQGLGGGHEFDAEDTAGIVQDLRVLEGRVHAHGN